MAHHAEDAALLLVAVADVPGLTCMTLTTAVLAWATGVSWQ